MTLVEQDQVMGTEQTSTQTGPTWGLDRIDERAPPMDALYVYPVRVLA